MELDEINHSYSRAARFYDLIWENIQLLFGFHKYRILAIKSLGDLEGKRVLDLGCGTGSNFKFLSKAVGEKGQVIAVDYSIAMLDKAQKKVKKYQYSNIEIIRDDVVTMDKVCGEFDAIISTYCLGIVYDIKTALDINIDSLKCNGFFSILDFSSAKPDKGLLYWFYPIYSRILVWWGVDTYKDVTDILIRKKWKIGRGILQNRLKTYNEVQYFSIAMMITGSKK